MPKQYLLTDLHFGMRNNSLEYKAILEESLQFFLTTANPNKLEDDLIITGDIFHTNESTNNMILDFAISQFKILSSAFRQIHVLVGNHDIYYKDRNDVTPIKILEHTCDNIKVYYTPEVITINNTPCLMLPWVSDYDKANQIIEDDNSGHIFLHADINNCLYASGVKISHGVSDVLLRKYKGVYAGHIHTKGGYYLGTLHHHDSSDVNTIRGYHYLNEDFDLVFVENTIAPRYISLSSIAFENMTQEEKELTLNNNWVTINMTLEYSKRTDSLKEATRIRKAFKCRNITMVLSEKEEANYEKLTIEVKDIVIDHVKVGSDILKVKRLRSEDHINKVFALYDEIDNEAKQK